MTQKSEGIAVADRRRGSTRRADRGFRILALLTTLATYLLIVLGGTVRVTGSGLACPDWPTCHGRLVPTLDQHVLIEYSHRLSASLVSVLVIALLIMALWVWRQPRYLQRLCAIAVGLLILQVILGAVTVRADLPPQIVTAHLATATALLGVLAAISVYSVTGRGGSLDPVARRFARAAMMAAGGTFLLILTGSYVVGSNAGLACHTWPLCNGQILPTGGHSSVDVNFFHRVFAILIGLGIAAVALRGWKTRRNRPLLLWTATAALAIYLAQIFVGAGNVWFGLTAPIRIAHLATAQALWLLTAALSVLAATSDRQIEADTRPVRERRPLPLPSADHRPRFGDRTMKENSSTRRGRR
ncbi:MAG: COX15/CtaA family protein [Dehalococcoidia bacterium]